MSWNLSSRLSTIIIVVGFGLSGVVFSLWGWNTLQNAHASSSWSATIGVISRSGISHHRGSEGNDSYSPQVYYQYQVDGQSFGNNQIKFSQDIFQTRRRAEKIIANYPLGQQVTVYYDPERPENAVLEPGVTTGSYIVLCFGVLFTLTALYIVSLRLRPTMSSL